MTKSLLYMRWILWIMTATWLVPWLAVELAPSNGGFTVIVVMLLLINPITALAVGVWSARDIKSRWYWPLLFAGMFVSGAYLFLHMKEWFYIKLYLILGYVPLVFCVLFRYLKKVGFKQK